MSFPSFIPFCRRLFVNVAAVLLTGLFAGGVSCAAVQGGLLTGLITRQRDAIAQPTAVSPRSGQDRAREVGGAMSSTDTPRAIQTTQRPTWCAQLGDDLAPVSGLLQLGWPTSGQR